METLSLSLSRLEVNGKSEPRTCLSCLGIHESLRASSSQSIFSMFPGDTTLKLIAMQTKGPISKMARFKRFQARGTTTEVEIFIFHMLRRTCFFFFPLHFRRSCF